VVLSGPYVLIDIDNRCPNRVHFVTFMQFNPFQSRDAIWYNTFNSVLHMLQLLGAGTG
jgi:hypothetical protein